MTDEERAYHWRQVRQLETYLKDLQGSYDKRFIKDQVRSLRREIAEHQEKANSK